jgi:aspartate aminotransferase
MPVYSVPKRLQSVRKAVSPFFKFMNDSSWAINRDPDDPEICDFTFGNPQEMPLKEYVDALQKSLQPQDKNWFAYKMNEPEAQAPAAASLSKRLGITFRPEDVLLTTGAFGGLSVALHSLVETGDEVLFISPPWFFYEGMITAAGGKPVRVRINLHTMDLDLEAIRNAITAKTRAIIINSPNNPTGKVYPPRTLERLSSLLTRESQRYRRTIFLISDESYSHVVFDDLECPSPAQYYPHTLLIYTYGKTLLAPGQRIGYIALPEKMPERADLREAIFATQIITAYAFPNALLQHALADIDRLSIDISQLQAKRDRIVDGLREIGYRVHKPEGTFYALPVSPIEDDAAFVNELTKHKIYCLPGNVVEMPGYFRISFTASMDMIERSLSGFEAAYHTVKRIRRAVPRFKVQRTETEKA